MFIIKKKTEPQTKQKNPRSSEKKQQWQHWYIGNNRFTRILEEQTKILYNEKMKTYSNISNHNIHHACYCTNLHIIAQQCSLTNYYCTVVHATLHQSQRAWINWLTGSRDEHGSGLDRTRSGLNPILAGSGLDRTAIFFKIGGSGLDRTEKIFVVLMWLYWKYQTC